MFGKQINPSRYFLNQFIFLRKCYQFYSYWLGEGVCHWKTRKVGENNEIYFHFCSQIWKIYILKTMIRSAFRKWTKDEFINREWLLWDKIEKLCFSYKFCNVLFKAIKLFQLKMNQTYSWLEENIPKKIWKYFLKHLEATLLLPPFCFINLWYETSSRFTDFWKK